LAERICTLSKILVKIFRILNASENPVAQNVGGYLVSLDTHCIFVNYHKEDDISESTKYEDRFVNNKEFDWMSKSNRKINSKDVQSILGKRRTKRTKYTDNFLSRIENL
jgi:hypothetical protein